MPGALQPVPATALDLRDVEVRRALREVVESPRAQGMGAGDSLFHRCSAYSGDRYAVLSRESFYLPLYVELRRTTSGDATAFSWNAADASPWRRTPTRERAGSSPTTACVGCSLATPGAGK